MIENIKNAVPLGRWGEPDDIANAVHSVAKLESSAAEIEPFSPPRIIHFCLEQVMFLCSDKAGWMTGETLRVSGGLEGVSAAPAKRELK